jgi:glycosyltransferase involved in cell wall biosynthesis
MNKGCILYFVNNAAFFVSHRLPVAIAAVRSGYRVVLVTGRAGSETMEKMAMQVLLDNGVRHRRVAITTSGLNPITELIGFVQLIICIIAEKPLLIHCASPKGNIYGGFAARICKVPAVVLAISGLGYAYTDSRRRGFRRKIIRILTETLQSFSYKHKNACLIVQNKDDLEFFVERFASAPKCVELISGSGVELDKYINCPIDNKLRIVLLPARILEDKGVREFVDAVSQIRHHTKGWRFILAGAADYSNPSAISEVDIRRWQSQGLIEWLGHVSDMIPLFKDASIVCLPSYREGMPKALLEAAASSCAIITTDTTGCRDAIVPNVTGLLVPVKNSGALAEALLTLINDPKLRRLYGENGRNLAIKTFSVESVKEKTLNIYERLLAN